MGVASPQRCTRSVFQGRRRLRRGGRLPRSLICPCTAKPLRLLPHVPDCRRRRSPLALHHATLPPAPQRCGSAAAAMSHSRSGKGIERASTGAPPVTHTLLSGTFKRSVVASASTIIQRRACHRERRKHLQDEELGTEAVWEPTPLPRGRRIRVCGGDVERASRPHHAHARTVRARGVLGDVVAMARGNRAGSTSH